MPIHLAPSSIAYLVAVVLLSSCGAASGPEDLPDIIEASEPVTDLEGNEYPTVRIGNQVWMAENLRSTLYADGVPIEHFVYDDEAANATVYGLLYRWSASMRNAASSSSNPSGVQGACPQGWHLPSDTEWRELIDYLGGEAVAGGKLKEDGLTHWQPPNVGATNESGFGALPAGWFDFTGEFYGMGETAFYRTATAPNPFEAFARSMRSGDASITRGGLHPDDAIPIRCVRNE